MHEEVEMELEALAAIYMDDFHTLEDSSHFEITLHPQDAADGESAHVGLVLAVRLTPDYPAVPPELEVRALANLTDEQAAECRDMLLSMAASDELLDTAMVYPLAVAAPEGLHERNVPELDMHAVMLSRMVVGEEPAADGDAAGTADRLRGKAKSAPGGAAGDWRGDPADTAEESYTPVTPEAFAEWRKEYDAEVAAAAAAVSAELLKRRGGGGDPALLTGRQIFEARGGRDLVLQDAGALDEGEEDIMLSRAAVGGDDGAEGDRGGECEEQGQTQEEPAESLLETLQRLNSTVGSVQ